MICKKCDSFLLKCSLNYGNAKFRSEDYLMCLICRLFYEQELNEIGDQELKEIGEEKR